MPVINTHLDVERRLKILESLSYFDEDELKECAGYCAGMMVGLVGPERLARFDKGLELLVQAIAFANPRGPILIRIQLLAFWLEEEESKQEAPHGN